MKTFATGDILPTAGGSKSRSIRLRLDFSNESDTWLMPARSEVVPTPRS